ncbi:MAG: hypothetical protein Q9170_007334 [Blastenia crenularia]
MPLYAIHNSSPNQATIPDTLPLTFALRTPPDRDIWQEPPDTNVFNAPYLTRTVPLSSLRSVRVTVSAQWKTKFDQGGLILIIPTSNGADKKEKKWIKTGIEFFDGRPNVSTVACDRWADWSLAPLPEGAAEKVTVELIREVQDGKKTSTLWVNAIDPSTGEKRPLREVSWVFGEDNLDCEIGVYAAKPIQDENNPSQELEVMFDGLTVEQWS